MRRVLVLLLSTLLVLTFLSSASAKAPKAGKACKKIGKVVVSKNREFTCIKRGSKRVWSKGVLVRAVPSPTPIPSQTVVAPTPTPSPTPTVREYTRADVASRNTATNCWTIINNSVYDLTAWIGAHPGGPGAIRSLCGVDGSSSFSSMHGNQSRPMAQLSKYLLGPLKP